MNSNILEIFPVPGVNKYIVMNENGLEVVPACKIRRAYELVINDSRSNISDLPDRRIYAGRG